MANQQKLMAHSLWLDPCSHLSFTVSFFKIKTWAGLLFQSLDLVSLLLIHLGTINATHYIIVQLQTIQLQSKSKANFPVYKTICLECCGTLHIQSSCQNGWTLIVLINCFAFRLDIGFGVDLMLLSLYALKLRPNKMTAEAEWSLNRNLTSLIK